MESELVQAAKTDIKAFGELYKLYFPKIYSYVLAILRSHEQAEDVVSQTFERALDKIHLYEDRGYSFGAWLYRIAHNFCIDNLRSGNKLTPFDDNFVLNTGSDSTSRNAEEQILQEQLWTNIARLDQSARQIIILRYIEGYSIKEVAYTLNKTEDAIKSTAKRALALLRLQMQTE